ncbi:hypothetical protein [Streptomyces sp. NPDC058612]|uniref:hypothetical protein n=1 Tax=Streptomyces sp. NPDC058612 TaxID=3346555 RepID=UPI00364E2725
MRALLRMDRVLDGRRVQPQLLGRLNEFIRRKICQPAQANSPPSNPRSRLGTI